MRYFFMDRFRAPERGKQISIPADKNIRKTAALKRWLRNDGKNSTLIMTIFVYLGCGD